MKTFSIVQNNDPMRPIGVLNIEENIEYAFINGLKFELNPIFRIVKGNKKEIVGFSLDSVLVKKE